MKNEPYIKALGRKESDGAWLLTSYALLKLGGDTMSDFEMISVVYMFISLVLVAVELGRNIEKNNKK